MSTESGSNVMVSWYRNRIADPTTDDEVYGYWVFVFGILVGVLGIVLFVVSGGTGAMLGWAVALTAVALVLLVVGPVIRLPLRRRATVVSYLGALVSFAGVVWFLIAYPLNWPEQSEPIVTVYAVGIAIIALGAAVVPLLSRERLDIPDEEPAVDETAVTEAEPATEETETADTATSEPEVAESKAGFEMYVDRAGKWRWRLRHDNGNIIADGGQGYSSESNAEKGITSVQRNAPGAGITREEPTEELEEVVEGVEPYAPEDVQADFEIYEDNAGEWRWRVRHDNGEIIADGGEGYATRGGLLSAIEGIRRYVSVANYLDVTPAAFEVYEDAGGAWRWRLVHQNGNILADGGQGYASRTGARDGIESVREAVAEGQSAFEIYEDAEERWRWRLRHDNGNIIADSGGSYSRERSVTDAVDRVVEYAPEADALDYTDAAFEVYKDKGGEWRWRLRHRNGAIMCDGGEGYAKRGGAHDGIDSVKRNVPNAEIEDLEADDTTTDDPGETDDSTDDADEV